MPIDINNQDLYVYCNVYRNNKRLGYLRYELSKNDARGFDKTPLYYYLCEGNTIQKQLSPIEDERTFYTSTNPSVAIVNVSTGIVKGLKQGTSIIKGYYLSGTTTEPEDLEDYNYQYIVWVKAHKEVTDKAVEATTSSTGLTEGSHCEICGKVIKEQKEIAKLEEKPVVVETKTISSQGADSTAANKFTADNGAIITVLKDASVSYKNKTVPTRYVTVPSKVKVNGKSYLVTKIDRDCFDGKIVKVVTLPSSIKSIGYKAFAGDKKLTKINIKSSALTVNKDAFKGLKKKQLKKIKVIVKKGNMSKKNFKKLKKQLVKAGLKASNIKRK